MPARTHECINALTNTHTRTHLRTLWSHVLQKLTDECFALAVELGYTYTYPIRHDDAQLWKIEGVAINTTLYSEQGIWRTVSTALRSPAVSAPDRQTDRQTDSVDVAVVLEAAFNSS